MLYRLSRKQGQEFEDLITPFIHKPPVEREDVLLIAEKLCKKYSLKDARPRGNEFKAFTGATAEGDHIKLAIFDEDRISTAWIHITVSIGEVRHYPWPNRTPVGEFGILDASLTFKTGDEDPLLGSAIQGNDIIGRKWRVGAVGPKGRTTFYVSTSGQTGDYYAQVDDPIEEMLRHRETLLKESDRETSFGESWKNAIVGWII